MIQFVLCTLAMLLTYQNDIRNKYEWYGHQYTKDAKLLVRLSEPLVSKTKSFKAEASVLAVVLHDTSIISTGQLDLYFSQDAKPEPSYGCIILIDAPIQLIKNSGNPGAFDYERYSKLQGKFHTVFLTTGSYIIMPGTTHFDIYKYLFATKDFIVSTLRKCLPPDKKISGLAEALLIGYKDDLDKELLQAYSNTGVVHIIAISGLHLGLIYAMLAWIFNVFPFIRKSKHAKVIFILTFLWLFSFVTGASASVLRSAVMFTCIVIGKNYFRSASIYNSLASSAFLLLCYNPYFFWDVGFQLSYCAIYGIVWLQKPIYRKLYVENKWLNKIWQMTAVTLSAQITTFPVCLYYFHQFPNMFLVTNLTAVPLSTLILFVEIMVVVLAWWPAAAIFAGKCCYGLIWVMNKIIMYCDDLPYGRIEAVHATLCSTLFLYIFLLSGIAWFLHKVKFFEYLSISCGITYMALFIVNNLQRQDQAKVIVYNISKKKAIDFINHDQFLFIGDSSLRRNEASSNYSLNPSRIEFQALHEVREIEGLAFHERYIQFRSNKIMIIDSAVNFFSRTSRLKIDVLIISGNPTLDLENINKAISAGIIVFDASNSLWKIAIWKKQCEQLLLRCFSVTDRGAFILDIR